eukprot:gene330-551_t
MLDINLFRTDKGGDPEIVRESQKRRYADVSLVDQVVEFDAEWRKARFEMENAKREFNALVKQIGDLRKAKQDATELQEQSKQLKESIKQLEEKEKQIIEARTAAIVPIGNIVHDSVPISDNE